MLALWRRLPIALRAVLAGSVMLASGTLPWALLFGANTRYWPAVPWSIPLGAAYLWLWWCYARGEGWPRATSEARREGARAHRLGDGDWGGAILAGMIGLMALMLFQGVFNRMVRLPQQPTDVLSKIPPLTLGLGVIMGSIVAGVVEEVSFRGYMQGPIERRHGIVPAIMVTGTLFWLAHYSHPETTVALLPFYFAVALVYGMMAHAVNSVLPGMILHAAGDIWVGMVLITTGVSEWQAPTTPRPLIWETGPDLLFFVQVAALLLAGGAAAWGFRSAAGGQSRSH